MLAARLSCISVGRMTRSAYMSGSCTWPQEFRQQYTDLVQTSCATAQHVSVELGALVKSPSPIPNPVECKSRRWKSGSGQQPRKVQNSTVPRTPGILAISADRFSYTLTVVIHTITRGLAVSSTRGQPQGEGEERVRTGRGAISGIYKCTS